MCRYGSDVVDIVMLWVACSVGVTAAVHCVEVEFWFHLRAEKQNSNMTIKTQFDLILKILYATSNLMSGYRNG